MSSSRTLISLDVGEKRIGVAVADESVRISVPFTTLEVDGSELEAIAELVVKEGAEKVIVGYPRNQSGEPTAQTRYVEQFGDRLKDMQLSIEYQDESLTSVLAEQYLQSHGKPYSKADIDAQAAALILQDYLEQHNG